ncbi:MAG: hypothetical protein LAP21_16700 [Acidobacteriia bacterium]|nr:hypothetical protein [Terriglobia bacterium]
MDSATKSPVDTRLRGGDDSSAQNTSTDSCFSLRPLRPLRPFASSAVKGFLLALLSISPAAAQTSPAAPKSLAAQCGKGLEGAPKRVFSNASDQGWQERTGAKPAHHDAVSMGGQTFEVFTSPVGRHFVRAVNYGTGSATFQTNCYNESGKLQSMHYEMRTGQGWGYEDMQEFSLQGKRLSHTTRFFNTEDHKQIARPPEADSFPDFTKPTIYQSFEALPFITAFKKRANATQK